MDSEKVIKRDNEYVLHTYNRNPIVLEKGHGLRAAGPEGQQYLDFTSGIGVNSLGYCDLDWAEAVSEQAHKLQHTSNLYYTAPCGKLAKKLCKRTGMSKVFFGNSGAEANEGAIKAARKYSVDHYRKDRTTVITLVNSFHGRTIATLTATGQEVFHNYFGPFNEGFLYAPAGDIEALEELVDRTTCAVMLELIQGEGGVMALDPDYVQAVRKLCDEKDLVLIVDEVQTGVGRTGTFLCCEHYNLKPDIVHPGQGPGRRPAHRRRAAERKGGRRHGPRHPRLHLRRQPGGLRRCQRGGGPHGPELPCQCQRARRPAACRHRKAAPCQEHFRHRPDGGHRVLRPQGRRCAGRLPRSGPAGADSQDPPAPAAAADPQRARCGHGAGDPERCAGQDGADGSEGAGMKNLLKMSDLSPAELTHILDVADQLKAQQKLGGTAPLLAGKTVALMFSKASTRTRTSFEVGVYQLGGLGNYMNTAELQAGRGEPLKDTARVLGRYYDCVVWRTYRQSDLEEFAELAGVPVINGLTDYAHPCQVLADLMTIRERRGSLAGRKLCFVGDGSSMANSLIVGGLLAGMQVTCVCPQSYRPAADVLMFAHKYGSAFHLTADPAEGVQDADVVATAVWNTAKPGTPESEQRLRDFVGYQLTGKLLESAKPDVMVLHCLPAHRGEEISSAVFEQHAPEIFDEAENRLHVQKAVLAILLAGK